MTPSDLDPQKREYFVHKYRAVDEDELRDTGSRIAELADEAADALRQVLAERGVKVAPAPAPVSAARGELPPEDRANQTRLATQLWNASISRHVQYLFTAHGLVFSYSLLGPNGLRMGAIPVFLAAASATYVLNRVGRRYTRNVCANADRPIDDKRSSLKTAAVVLWLGLPVAALIGVMLASAVRGA